jgi:hypothetical protein
MFINPTHVLAATEPSSGVQGQVHFSIHCSIWYHHLYTTTYVSFLLTVDNTHLPFIQPYLLNAGVGWFRLGLKT